MAKKSIGFIETFGLAACVAAADAAVKSANVKLLGYEYARGGGMCTVKVEGNTGACKAACEAGKRAANAVNGSLPGTKSVLLKGRPADQILDVMVYNRETVGGDIALAEGYRPKGDSKKPVLVKNWKPKEVPVEVPKEEIPETPAEAPVQPVEDDSKEETESDEDSDPESQETEEEPVTEDPVETPVEETAEVPEEATEEIPVEVTEEAPIEEPAEEPKEETVEEVVEDNTETAEPSEPATPKKSTSTGRKRSRRKKKKDE